MEVEAGLQGLCAGVPHANGHANGDVFCGCNDNIA